MSPAPGTRLDSYELISLPGEGGRGQVYRGRDTRLNCDVTIRIVPDVFAHDSERVVHCTREAQTLASLNHPNIAWTHGVIDDNQPVHAHRLHTEARPIQRAAGVG